MTYQYIVKRPFKYGGKVLKVGEVFEPGAGNFDRQIIESDKYVMIQEVAAKPAAQAAKPRRRSKSK